MKIDGKMAQESVLRARSEERVGRSQRVKRQRRTTQPSRPRTSQSRPRFGLDGLVLCYVFGLTVAGSLCMGCTKTNSAIAAHAPVTPSDPGRVSPTTHSAVASPQSSTTTSEGLEQSQTPPIAKAPLPDPIDKALDCQRSDLFSDSHSRKRVFDGRYGANAVTFSEVPTTQQSPLEACGLSAALQALSELQCDDGSHPFSDSSRAHAARTGNTGPGGRCNSVIDLYVVPCSEERYLVHLDMYFCGPDSQGK